ncbi:hypothetical protein [Deinococcus sonorensis]|uniref:Uncharacterized protein n=2 Tax=Deinococcus sonorensis TaxID=309891 RepID=A0AAU7UC00_9DEIO
MNTSTLADGIYSYTRPAMWGQAHTVTVQVTGGRPTLGTLNGEAMTGNFWPGVVAADLARCPFTFTPAAQPFGKARACRLHRTLSRLGLGHSDHYRLASASLGRLVDSLAALTEQEARKVWNHARQLRMTYNLTAA